MRIERADPAVVKGWYLGPWNSDLPISLGYAPKGIDEPHIHTRITEVYLVARGTSELRVGDRTVTLTAGDVVVVEPGEPHTLMFGSVWSRRPNDVPVVLPREPSRSRMMDRAAKVIACDDGCTTIRDTTAGQAGHLAV